jgi:hypothetical protein
MTLAFAGGHDEQPWLWNSSTTVKLLPSAKAAEGAAVIESAAAANSSHRASVFTLPLFRLEGLIIWNSSQLPDSLRESRSWSVRGGIATGL